MAANYRFLTMATSPEERSYLVAAIKHYYPSVSISAFLRQCVEAELGRLAEQKGSTVQKLLLEAMSLESKGVSCEHETEG